MTASVQEIINKYQGVASQKIVHAVEKAAERTGANFSFLMEKAATESGFNPAAKAKSSTATGLFQFIETTWLNMVKEHGAKYGLASFANQIQIKDGKPCVDDCKVKDAILNLRKNPEISALMAGELSADNKAYLERCTGSAVGKTELYLAHFMGAGGATKFLNSRETNGNAVAATLFPKEARANKNVFFDPATGHARTLNEIYDVFARKFDEAGVQTADSCSASPSFQAKAPETADMMAAMTILPSGDSIIWNDANSNNTGFSRAALPSWGQKLSMESMLIVAQAQQNMVHTGLKEPSRYNYF